jgi:hypothetical protein
MLYFNPITKLNLIRSIKPRVEGPICNWIIKKFWHKNHFKDIAWFQWSAIKSFIFHMHTKINLEFSKVGNVFLLHQSNQTLKIKFLKLYVPMILILLLNCESSACSNSSSIGSYIHTSAKPQTPQKGERPFHTTVATLSSNQQRVGKLHLWKLVFTLLCIPTTPISSTFYSVEFLCMLYTDKSATERMMNT